VPLTLPSTGQPEKSKKNRGEQREIGPVEKFKVRGAFTWGKKIEKVGKRTGKEAGEAREPGEANKGRS